MGSGFQHRRPADSSADEPADGSSRPSLPGSPGLKRPNLARRIWRRTRLALHVAEGLLTVLTVFPLAGVATRRTLRQSWSRRLLKVLGIELRTSAGTCITPGAMLIANHVSWIDIFVINTLAPAAFVSKDDVRRWPAIGWLAARNDTLFLQRGSRAHARTISSQMAAKLDAGATVALFPEGTTTDGSHVLHFHAALLQAAIDTGHPIQPVALRYRTPEGLYTDAAAYTGDATLMECISRIVAEPRIVADVALMDPVQTEATMDRRELANVLRAQIAERVAEELPATTAVASAELSENQPSS